MHYHTGRIRPLALMLSACILYYSQVSSVLAGDPMSGKADIKMQKEPACSNLTFVTRAEWGAIPPKKRQDMVLPVGYSVVHHTASKQCSTQEECSKLMRSFQHFHMVTRGWDDIAYNFLIGGDEKVYIGRGWDTVGAHAGSTYYNSHSIGTSIIGNYNDILPTPGVLQVLKDLNECGAKSGYMTSRYVLRGHRDVRQLGPTDCPGETLYKEIRTWPHYLESDKTSHPESDKTSHPDGMFEVALRETADELLETVQPGSFQFKKTQASSGGGDNQPACSNLTFVTRAQWGAIPPKKRQDMVLPVGYAVVHHTASKQCSNLKDCSVLMRSFQHFHMVTRGWDDIGYNFLIGGDEKVYIGRGWDTVGAQAGSIYYNSHSIGTSIIGTYTKILPSPGVLQVLKDLNECGAKSGYMTSRYVLRGHRDVRQLGPTECPGETLYKEIRTWPHYLEPYNI
ncbi:peptidoglycan-recognition protein LF-like [Asterias rubens]|uniref:peptidoglycan-recognition protein LF-like n=1 Tax=Asterias rubens TaxID=7604 RepID=UPI00145568EA|nr:peptidoglycan-recognition protein LF-like [Asterias rubens]